MSRNLRAGDAIIAAMAIENDVMLCMTNVKRYRQIPMLTLFSLKVTWHHPTNGQILERGL